MRILFYFGLFWLCLSEINGAVFDPYSRRYNLRSSTFETLFPTTAKTAIQNLINSAPIIDNIRCKSAYQFVTTSTLNQLINFQYELVELCPKVFETIRYTNITKWGPVEEFLQIWSMKFVDSLWKKIQTKSLSTCRCQLYEDFITAATSDTVLLQYLKNNYDPSLCLINTETMYKWHQFLQRAQIKNRITKFLIVGDFSIQFIQGIAKSYLTETRYNSYFELPTPTSDYPLFIYFNATVSSPNWTMTQKSVIVQLRNYYKQQFPTMNLSGRQQLFLAKFSESIDLSFASFSTLNRISLEPSDAITHYDLIIYLSRKDFLISKRLPYISTPVIPCTVTTSTTTIKPTTTTTTTLKPTTTSTTTTTTKMPTTTTTSTTTTTTTKKPTTTATTTTTTKMPATTTTSTTSSTTTTTTSPSQTTTTACSSSCSAAYPTAEDTGLGEPKMTPCGDILTVECIVQPVFYRTTNTEQYQNSQLSIIDLICGPSGKYFFESTEVNFVSC